MKIYFAYLFVAVLMFIMLSCNKECETSNATCQDVPPTNELCQAAFSRWFYDKATDSCQQIGYSGCSQKGFASQAECEQCKCN